MKYSYKEMPERMKGTYGDFSKNFGFSWKEFVMTISSPLFLVTTYKSNGKPNACMQSWANFTSANHGNGFYVLLGSVNKSGHLYTSLKEKKVAVINFMSATCHAECMDTIRHNDFDADKTGDNGLLYNLHYPMNPEHVEKTGYDYAGVIVKKIDVAEY